MAFIIARPGGCRHGLCRLAHEHGLFYVVFLLLAGGHRADATGHAIIVVILG